MLEIKEDDYHILNEFVYGIKYSNTMIYDLDTITQILSGVNESLVSKREDIHCFIQTRKDIEEKIKEKLERIDHLKSNLKLKSNDELTDNFVEIKHTVKNGNFVFEEKFSQIEDLCNSIRRFLYKITDETVYLMKFLYPHEIEPKNYNSDYSLYTYVRNNNGNIEFIIDKQNVINCESMKEIESMNPELIILNLKLKHCEKIAELSISNSIFKYLLDLLLEEDYMFDHANTMINKLQK